jgi:hypothetical protein
LPRLGAGHGISSSGSGAALWGGAQELHQAYSSCFSRPLLEEISCGFDHSHLSRDRRGNLLIYDDGILFR